MSNQCVISVENLGKSYNIAHRTDRQRYRTFREALSQKVRGLARPRRPPEQATEEFWALKDVSFSVKQGEVVGIVGRNGAGKSTLLKILSRITEPTQGRVRTRGRVASLLEVGTGFHPELTGRENIYLNGAILGMSRAEVRKKFSEIVAFAEVEKFLDTPVKRFSSGMYVRLAFAVAAHLDPEILIVDEVLAVGDTQFQRKCIGKIHDVAVGGRTVLFVSHQLGVLKDLCSSGILLAGGKLQLFDRIDRTIQEYLTVDRHGTDSATSLHIESVEIGNGGKSNRNLFFGEPLEIVVALRDLPVNHPVGLNLSIRNESGRLLTNYSTNPHDGQQMPVRKRLRVKFTMGFCCYSPGKYFLDLAVTEPAIRIVDELDNAEMFEVLPRAIGGWWSYEDRFGEVFPQHSWEFTD